MNSKIKYRRDLWKLLTDVKGDAAEIGVAEGNFSHDILGWPVALPRVYMVDRWSCNPGQKGDGGSPQQWHEKNYSMAINRVAKFGKRAVVLRGDSARMADSVPNKSLALLYIDGDHSFMGVLRDLVAWVPKVKAGGIVALHDYENNAYGVKKAVEKYCNGFYTIHQLPEDRLEDAGAYFHVC